MRSLYEIIAAKRDGESLADEELSLLIESYASGEVADYQMSAFLMAAFINGLNPRETAALTHAMLESGERFEVKNLDRPLIDKHSTGGVGDKLSLTLSPLLAGCGIAVGMLSGRGLGHTGGTLDKLESIPGLRVFHTTARFGQLLRRHSFAIGGQTEKIAPADRKLYALRDVTGTVESIPLIVASIMSKKLALRSDGILFDVKCGSGAFMKLRHKAVKLARALLGVSDQYRLPARAVITSMDQPTGRMIGNFLEVIEAVETLQGKGPSDTVELTTALAADMLIVSGVESDYIAARKRVTNELNSGRGYEAFCRYVRDCGGDSAALEEPRRRIARVHKGIVKSQTRGYIHSFATEQIGRLAVELGAGRKKADERVDPLAGIALLVTRGDYVEAGQPLAEFYASRNASLRVAGEFLNCLTISPEPPSKQRTVLKRL